MTFEKIGRGNQLGQLSSRWLLQSPIHPSCNLISEIASGSVRFCCSHWGGGGEEAAGWLFHSRWLLFCSMTADPLPRPFLLQVIFFSIPSMLFDSLSGLQGGLFSAVSQQSHLPPTPQKINNSSDGINKESFYFNLAKPQIIIKYIHFPTAYLSSTPGYWDERIALHF